MSRMCVVFVVVVVEFVVVVEIFSSWSQQRSEEYNLRL